MSANILWQPIKGKSLEVNAPSSFLETLELGFGNLPIDLNQSRIPMLEGMKAAIRDANQKEAIQTLIDALYLHGTIRIWTEY